MRHPPTRPVSEHVCAGQPGSFRAWAISPPFFPFHWHHHRELELTLILRGDGTRVVGDRVEAFAAGDLVLLGSGLPHNWYAAGPVPGGMQAMVVQFPPELIERLAGVATEWRPLARLAEEARRGLAITGATVAQVAPRLTALVAMPAGSPAALGELVAVLALLAGGAWRHLSSDAHGGHPCGSRFAPVFALVQEHLPAAVSQRRAAAQARLGPAAFCRAFRAEVGETFTAYVLGRRLALAADALAAGDRPVARIAADSGFAGLAHFNRQFRRRFGCTPSAYRRMVRG